MPDELDVTVEQAQTRIRGCAPCQMNVPLQIIQTMCEENNGQDCGLIDNVMAGEVTIKQYVDRMKEQFTGDVRATIEAAEGEIRKTVRGEYDDEQYQD